MNAGMIETQVCDVNEENCGTRTDSVNEVYHETQCLAVNDDCDEIHEWDVSDSML